MTQLIPMQASSFAAYREMAAAGYAQDNVASGRWPAQGALQRSYDDFDASLPMGLATPDHHLFDIVDTASHAVVGVIWYSVVVKNGLASAFVWDVEIKPAHRRKGHGRAAFEALESQVQALGLTSIGLHVFAHNAGAQALYQSLGYGVTGVNMRKQLAAAGA